MEFGDHSWRRETKIVAAHVVGGVEATDGDPVKISPSAEAGGIGGMGERSGQGHGSHLNESGGCSGIRKRVKQGVSWVYPSTMNLKKYRHVIWDWNGTLLDDAWLCREIMNGQLRQRGLPTMSEERYEAVFDFPVESYYRRVGFSWEKETFEQAGTEFILEYEKRKKECRLQIGASDVLRQVAATGVSQAVLSAYSHQALEGFLVHFGVREHFLSVAGSEDHYAEGKVVQGLRMLEALHVAPEETVLVGDTTHDAEVAKAMGVACILIPCGHNSRDRLMRCGVEVIAGLGELRFG